MNLVKKILIFISNLLPRIQRQFYVGFGDENRMTGE